MCALPAVEPESKACPLAQDVFNGAPARIDWELVDVLHYIGLGKFLKAEPLGVRPVQNPDYHLNDKGQIRVKAYSA